jgi:dTDP-4-dehydrorhamnose 3,5-epimerase
MVSSAASDQSGELPQGVKIHTLTAHADSRGSLTEIYREVWDLGCRPVQLNAMSSVADTMRGVHVHVTHADHLTLIGGRMLLGLHDLRGWSPTAGRSRSIELDARKPCAVVIPVGVAHGFYFPEASVLVYGVSHYWNPADELGCRWDDPKLGLRWPTTAPLLSERDQSAPDYGTMRRQFEDAWRLTGAELKGASAA